MKGYVYIISNKAMPGIFKIGYTMQDPQLRAKELCSTGVPHPFTVDYEILVDNPYELEQRVHRSLSDFNENKEWFSCDFGKCVATIHECYNGTVYYERFFKSEREEEYAKNKIKLEIEAFKKRRAEREKEQIHAEELAKENEERQLRIFVENKSHDALKDWFWCAVFIAGGWIISEKITIGDVLSKLIVCAFFFFIAVLMVKPFVDGWLEESWKREYLSGKGKK